MKVKPKFLRDLFDQAEIDAINSAALLMGRRHPTWYPLVAKEQSAVDILSNQAVKHVAGELAGPTWLDDLKPRLCSVTDHEGAASALAELRAYGAMLEAGFAVKPIPRKLDVKTPDFEVEAGDGPVVVEIFAKHQDSQQKEMLEKVQRGETPPQVQRSVVARKGRRLESIVIESMPAGVPDPSKPGDSVQANLISRVCGIKGAEGQIDATKPALLWMDFSNFGIWPEGLGVDQLEPLISGHQGLTSGGIWYAHYGWKGAPIFEEDIPLNERIVSMGHDGRFRLDGKKKSRFSGTVVFVARKHGATSCLLENPWAKSRLPDQARRYTERLPWFDLHHSVCDWTAGDAEARIAVSRREIEAMKNWHDKLNG